MTLSISRDRVTHVGNGVTTVFPTSSIEKLDATNVRVYVIDSNGIEVLKTYGVDYTLTSSGVEFVTPPPAGTTVLIRRVVPLEQPDQYKTNAPFPAEVTENRFDQIVMALQQLDGDIKRTIRLNPADPEGIGTLPPPNARANKFLGFDSTGAPIAVTNPASNVGGVTPSDFGEGLIQAPTADVARDLLGAAAAADVLKKNGSVTVAGDLPFSAGTAIVREGETTTAVRFTNPGEITISAGGKDIVVKSTGVYLEAIHVPENGGMKRQGDGTTKIYTPNPGVWSIKCSNIEALQASTSGVVVAGPLTIQTPGTASNHAARLDQIRFTVGNWTTVSGGYVDFVGIPSGVSEVTMHFDAVALDTAGHLLVQVGTGPAVTTSGYLGEVRHGSNNNASSTSGLLLYRGSGTAQVTARVVWLRGPGGFWTAHVVGVSDGVAMYGFARIVLSGGDINVIRLTRSGASGNLSGQCAIGWRW